MSVFHCPGFLACVCRLFICLAVGVTGVCMCNLIQLVKRAHSAENEIYVPLALSAFRDKKRTLPGWLKGTLYNYSSMEKHKNCRFGSGPLMKTKTDVSELSSFFNVKLSSETSVFIFIKGPLPNLQFLCFSIPMVRVVF